MVVNFPFTEHSYTGDVETGKPPTLCICRAQWTRVWTPAATTLVRHSVVSCRNTILNG